MSKKIEVPVQDFRIFTDGNAVPLVTIKIPLECCGVKMEILPGTPEDEFNRFVGKERCEHCKSYPGIWQAYVVDKIHFNGTRPRKVSMRGNLHNVSYEKITFDHADALNMIKDSLATKKVEPMFFDPPTFRDTEEPGQLMGLAFEINRHASSFVESLPGNQFRYRDNGVRKIIKDLIVNNKEFLPVLRWGRRKNNFLFNVYFDPVAIRKAAAIKKEKLTPAKKNEEVQVVPVNAANTIANIVIDAVMPRVIDPAPQPIPDVPLQVSTPAAPVPLSMELQSEMLTQLAAQIRNESNVRMAPARSARDQEIADRIVSEGIQIQPRGEGMTIANSRSLQDIWNSFDYGSTSNPATWVVREPIQFQSSPREERVESAMAAEIRSREDDRLFEEILSETSRAQETLPSIPEPESAPATPALTLTPGTGTSIYGSTRARRIRAAEAQTRARAQEGTRIARARRAIPSASSLPVTNAGPRPRTRRARGV